MSDATAVILTAAWAYPQAPSLRLGWTAAGLMLVLFILAAAALAFFFIRRGFHAWAIGGKSGHLPSQAVHG